MADTKAAQPPPPSSPPPGGDKKEYTPVKDRPLDQALKPKLSAPWLCPGVRDWLYRWYPGPEIMMHKMHWTEWIFIIFLASAVVLFIIGADHVPLTVFAVLIIIESAIALVMVWGIAKYKSLADLASRLEQIAMDNRAQVNAYQEINNEWERSLQDSQENINQFSASLGLVENDAKAISELTEALGGLVNVKKKIQAEEKELFKVSVRHQKVTRAEIDEKNRGNMKKHFGRLYDRIAKRGSPGSGGGGRVAIDTPEEIKELKQKLFEYEFLNQKKIGPDGKPTNELLYNWPPVFDESASDGVVMKWELLDDLDSATNSYFLEIRDAVKTRTELQAEYDKVMKNQKK